MQKVLTQAAFGQSQVETAPLLIVVCADVGRSSSRYGDRGSLYAIQDADAATMCLLLAAHELGLGACWNGAFDDALVREALGMQERYLANGHNLFGMVERDAASARSTDLERDGQLDRIAVELRKIIDDILGGRIKGEDELEASKRNVSAYLGLSSLPSNADILRLALPAERERLKMLVRKPTRTLSGVAVIAAMTSPARCPHGTCVPCPGGISHVSPQKLHRPRASCSSGGTTQLRSLQSGKCAARSAGRDRSSPGQSGVDHHGRNHDLTATRLPALVCEKVSAIHE